MMNFLIFSHINQLVELKIIIINGGGTKGGTLKLYFYFIFIFYSVMS
ncbi:hypothetical protein SEEJ0721_03271 [Salmonella enterica subsp. enterica serovar Javiana str. 10721]|nr:hypothetical protein SEEPB962_13362 [Salmonella enterica subsp. enterica serovar Paratyphi B str. ATCC 51962]ESG86016.1 hypothetical protein SEEJ0721_03271 [Salmonella enterica subsp. enterica serovar Javiana str. 10721]